MTPISPDLAILLNACHSAPLDWQAKLVAADKAQEDGLDSCAWWLRWMASHCQPPANGDFGPLPSRRRLHDLSVPTGSRVYGVPTPDSDWDWVVPILPGYEHHLTGVRANCDPHSSGPSAAPYEGATPSRLAGSYRFGPIDMIHVDSRDQLVVWTQSTSLLRQACAVNGP